MNERSDRKLQQWLLSQVCNLKLWHKGEKIAPHKPILLLYALTKCQPDAPQALPFIQIEQALTPILKALLSNKAMMQPQYPFWRLQADKLWLVTADSPMRQRKGNTDPLRSELIKMNARGGLPTHVYQLLAGDQAFKDRIIKLILNRYFSSEDQKKLAIFLKV